MKITKKIAIGVSALLMAGSALSSLPANVSAVSAQTAVSTANSNDPIALFFAFHAAYNTSNIITNVNSLTKKVVQKATVNGTEFSFTIDFKEWTGATTPEQIVTCSKLFWYSYPTMYDRFKDYNTPTDVNLIIKNTNEGLAWTLGGADVYLRDTFLWKSKNDYDCITHELAHVIQSGWNGEYLPTELGKNEDGEDMTDTFMIERFADYCRYVYAYNDGYYNDKEWGLQPSNENGENRPSLSVRFWTWLDYRYSNSEIDIMQRINHLVKAEKYTENEWNLVRGIAWREVLDGTDAESKNMAQLWMEYLSYNKDGFNFATCASMVDAFGASSDLDMYYDVRGTIKSR